MARINLNDVAMDIASAEVKKEQISIAQIKEVLRIIFTTFSLEKLFLIWLSFNRSKP